MIAEDEIFATLAKQKLKQFMNAKYIQVEKNDRLLKTAIVAYNIGHDEVGRIFGRACVTKKYYEDFIKRFGLERFEVKKNGEKEESTDIE